MPSAVAAAVVLVVGVPLLLVAAVGIVGRVWG